MSALHDATAAPPRLSGSQRYSGTLAHDAQLHTTVGSPPHTLLCVQLQPPRGLAYAARIDLGTCPANRAAAEALLPHLRRGALLTVAGEGVALHTEHGQPVLHVQQPHSAVLLRHAEPPLHMPAPEPDLFAMPTEA